MQVAVMDCGQVRQWFYNAKTRRLTYGLKEEDGGKCLTVGSKNNVYTAQVKIKIKIKVSQACKVARLQKTFSQPNHSFRSRTAGRETTEGRSGSSPGSTRGA